MFGPQRDEKNNPLASAIANHILSSGEQKETRFDEGVKLYWAEFECPIDPEGRRGWEAARDEVEHKKL